MGRSVTRPLLGILEKPILFQKLLAILSLFTARFWILVWFLLIIFSSKKTQCTVCGNKKDSAKDMDEAIDKIGKPVNELVKSLMFIAIVGMVFLLIYGLIWGDGTFLE